LAITQDNDEKELSFQRTKSFLEFAYQRDGRTGRGRVPIRTWKIEPDFR